MHIILDPRDAFEELEASVNGDILTLNGVDIDFSFMNEGDVLDIDAIETPWLLAPITRENGEIKLKLRFPCRSWYSEEARFPDPAGFHITSGKVEFPT